MSFKHTRLITIVVVAILLVFGGTVVAYQRFALHADTTVKTCTRPLDVVFVVDKSESMYTKMSGLGITRLKNVDNALLGVADRLDNYNTAIRARTDIPAADKAKYLTQVGLVVYAVNSKAKLTETSDIDALRKVIDKNGTDNEIYQDGKPIGKFTNIGAGMLHAWSLLDSGPDRAGIAKIVILYSDGFANRPKKPYYSHITNTWYYNADAAKAYARDAATTLRTDSHLNPKAEVYTIGFGTDKEHDRDLLSDFNFAGPSGTTDHNDHYLENPDNSPASTAYDQIFNKICDNPPTPPGPIGVDLKAVPPIIMAGESSELQWHADGQPEKLTLTSDKDGVLLGDANNPTGKLDVSPPLSRLYNILATKGDLKANAQAAVTVLVPSPSPSPQPTLTPTASPAVSPGSSPAVSPSPASSPLVSPDVSPDVSPVASPTKSASPLASPVASPTPTKSASPIASPTIKVTASPVATTSPTGSPTKEPVVSPIPSPSIIPATSPSPGQEETITISLVVDPNVIDKGQCSILSWEVAGPADKVSIVTDKGVTVIADAARPRGTSTVCPDVSTNYIAQAYKGGVLKATANAPLVVRPVVVAKASPVILPTPIGASPVASAPVVPAAPPKTGLAGFGQFIIQIWFNLLSYVGVR